MSTGLSNQTSLSFLAVALFLVFGAYWISLQPTVSPETVQIIAEAFSEGRLNDIDLMEQVAKMVHKEVQKMRGSTAGAHILEIGSKLFVWSIVLSLLASLLYIIGRKKWQWLSVFVYLFLAAAIIELATISYIQYVMKPAIYQTLIVQANETPLNRAYRICKGCGLTEPEIDTLIQQVSESEATPEESVDLWKQTADPENVELCRDCVDTVMEAAG